MRMARVNVYLPDDLADQAKEAGLNVSSLTQDAVRSALSASQIEDWLSQVGALSSLGIEHDAVMAAISGAKDDLEGNG
jgi:post-segregation antitoxin (ccd killing protein)